MRALDVTLITAATKESGLCVCFSELLLMYFDRHATDTIANDND